MSCRHPVRRCGGIAGARRGAVVAALAMLGVAVMVSPAYARVLFVTQGVCPHKGKARCFHRIQEAVNRTMPGSWVLIAPGVYDEEVKITGKRHHNIWIRGLNRNTVIIDGQNKIEPNGRNGIEVFKTNNVYIENLTVRNFDRPSLDGPGGNEIWWNGGPDSGKIGAHGWYGRYLTAYDTGLNGGYGIFTGNETEGRWEKIYASGFNDSGMYLGACPECRAVIKEAVMENNALGYSGSNSGGNLIIEKSTIDNNSTGIAPNSENPGDGPPPQNGACHPVQPWEKGHEVLPSFSTTSIERCTIIRENHIENNGNLSAPASHSAAAAPYGAGVELPGDYGDLVEKNVIKKNPSNGVLAFEYPNPFPPVEDTIYFQNAGNRISENTLSENGGGGGLFAGDITLEGGIFGKESTNDCVEGNSVADATYPEHLETTWACTNATTPNPVLPSPQGIEYLLEKQEQSEKRSSVPQPAPPEQETMPNPCAGVPANPFCS